MFGKSNFFKLVTFLLLLINIKGISQEIRPVSWFVDVKAIDKDIAEIIITAKIEDGWELYNIEVPPGGPLPTVFHFEKSKNYTLIGGIQSKPKPKEVYDEIFEMEIGKWSEKVVFNQKIKINNFSSFIIPLYIEYMACNNVSCVPLDFSINISIDGSTFKSFFADNEISLIQNDSANQQQNDSIDVYDKSNASNVDFKSEFQNQSGVLGIIWLGFLAGLLALLTPCVWPVVPMTVSYFISRSSSRKQSIRNAIFYAISVIVIYVSLGLIVSVIFGPTALGEISSSIIFNLLFFILLILFALSFFGVFEIRLPSGWINKLDNKSEKKQNILGVFLMALTLVMVSFSCTGPIVGWLLVEAATSSNVFSPLLGMLSFSVALAFPFSLLVLFPTWLKSLPRSGGWMNNIKVVLAFLMLAFSLRFLSSADLVAGWNILPRELFVALWIVIFFLMGLYLLGKIRFAHDDDIKVLSVTRLFFSMASFVIAVLLLPGLFGAPLRLISGFLPPITSQTFNLNVALNKVESNEEINNFKIKQGPYGLIKFLNYDEGLTYAQKLNKPIFLDFTAHTCSNCKKMESSVFINPKILHLLRDKFVFISLYVDDKEELSLDKQYISKIGERERKINTWGKKWSDFQISRFGVNALPYYVLLDSEGNQLLPGIGYTPSIEKFYEFLSAGLKKFNENQNIQR